MPSTPKRKTARRKTGKRKSSRDKVRAHRIRLRKLGLRPIQIWVPDTPQPRFAAEARRQSQAIASSAHAARDQAFIAALAEFKFE